MEINKRIITNDKNGKNIILNDSQILSLKEKRQERYNELKLKLKSNFKESVYNKLEAMKILKEIKDNYYYKLDGYKNFSEFLLHYNVAKSQAYNYLKIAKALEEGILEEQYVLENGFREVLSFIQNKEGKTFKKSKINPIKPLRFQLKDQDSYNFYKKNARLTGFILDNLFKKEKEILEKFINEFETLQNKG